MERRLASRAVHDLPSSGYQYRHLLHPHLDLQKMYHLAKGLYLYATSKEGQFSFIH